MYGRDAIWATGSHDGTHTIFELTLGFAKAPEDHFVKERCVEENLLLVEKVGKRQKKGGRRVRHRQGRPKFQRTVGIWPSKRHPKGREVKWVEKTKTLHNAGTLLGEKKKIPGTTDRKRATRAERTFWQCRRTTKSTSVQLRRERRSI